MKPSGYKPGDKGERLFYMKRAFEAIWEHGQIVPIESVNINEHTRLLVVILDEKNFDSTSLIQEARRQSMLVSQHHQPEEEIWEANIDDTDWRA
jgi:predicted DNA-binding antitoxin AbrB/MazE fold protein